MTLRQRCYHYIRRVGCANVAAVASALGVSREQAGGTMRELMRSGWLQREAYSIYSVLREGDPVDSRGRNERSQMNLTTEGRMRAAEISKQRASNEPCRPNPKPATLLEQCWGWM